MRRNHHRYRIIQMGETIFVERKGWIFWRHMEHWFKSEQAAADFIAERIEEEHTAKKRRVLYDTHPFKPLDKSGFRWIHRS